MLHKNMYVHCQQRYGLYFKEYRCENEIWGILRLKTAYWLPEHIIILMALLKVENQ